MCGCFVHSFKVYLLFFRNMYPDAQSLYVFYQKEWNSIFLWLPSLPLYPELKVGVRLLMQEIYNSEMRSSLRFRKWISALLHFYTVISVLYPASYVAWPMWTSWKPGYTHIEAVNCSAEKQRRTRVKEHRRMKVWERKDRSERTWFLIAAATNCHKLGDIKQQKLIPSPFWKLKVPDQCHCV